MMYIVYIYAIVLHLVHAASKGESVENPWITVARGVDGFNSKFVVIDRTFWTVGDEGLQTWDKDHWEPYDDGDIVGTTMKHYRGNDGERKLVALVPSKLGVMEWSFAEETWKSCQVRMAALTPLSYKKQIYAIGHIKSKDCGVDRTPVWMLAGFFVSGKTPRIFVEVAGRDPVAFSTAEIGKPLKQKQVTYKVKKDRGCVLFGGCNGSRKPEKEKVETIVEVPAKVEQLQVGCGYVWALSTDGRIYKADATEGHRVKWIQIVTNLGTASLTYEDRIAAFILDPDCTIFALGITGATYKWYLGMWQTLTPPGISIDFNARDIDIDNDGFMYAADYSKNAIAYLEQRMWVPAVRFGPTIGYWNKFALSNVGGGGGSMKISYSKTDGSEVSKEEETAFTKGISATAGVKVSAKPMGCGVEGSLSLTGSASKHVAQKVDESVQSSFSKGEGTACSAKAPDTGPWTGYRWMIDREANDKTVMSVSTCYFHFKTGADQQLPPLCMPGYCVDMACQECSDAKYEIAPPDHVANEIEAAASVQQDETSLLVFLLPCIVFIAGFACYTTNKRFSTPLLHGYEQEI